MRNPYSIRGKWRSRVPHPNIMGMSQNIMASHPSFLLKMDRQIDGFGGLSVHLIWVTSICDLLGCSLLAGWFHQGIHIYTQYLYIPEVFSCHANWKRGRSIQLRKFGWEFEYLGCLRGFFSKDAMGGCFSRIEHWRFFDLLIYLPSFICMPCSSWSNEVTFSVV